MKKEEKFLLKAREFGIEKLTEMSEAVAYINHGLSWSYGSDADFYKAIEFQNKAIEARKQLLGDSSLVLAVSYSNQGYNYKRLGKYDSAQILTENAFNIRKSILEPDHPEIAESMFEIAWLKSARGFYRDALDLHHKALEIRLAVLEPTNLQIATSLNNIAWCYVQLGDYEKALEHYEVALAMRIERYGKNHTAVATTYHSMGVLFSQKGNYEKAILYHLKGNQIFNSKKRADHQDNVQFYNFLGMAYMGKHDYENALKYHLMALEIAENISGDHLYKSQTYAYLGKVYSVLGDIERQGIYYKKALPIEVSLNGPDHQNVAKIYVNLAGYYSLLGEKDLQLEYLTKALKIRRETFGDTHPLVVQTYTAFGTWYQDQDQLDEALATYEQALSSLKNNSSGIDQNISSRIAALPVLQKKAEVLKMLGRRNREPGRLNLAIDTYEQAAQILDSIRYSFMSNSARQNVTERSAGLFEGAIEILYDLYKETGEQQYISQAFNFMEKSKGFLLRQAIKDAEARQFSGVPDSLLQIEREFRIDIAFLESRLSNLRSEADTLKRASLISQLFEVRNSYQQLMEELENNYPRYYQLKYASDGNEAVDRTNSLLKPNTVLLQYFYGEKAIYTIGLSTANASFVRVNNLDFASEKIKDFRKSISDYQFLLNRPVEADQMYANSAYDIYTLLVEPVIKPLGNIEQLIVIPDGEINHINLEALLFTNVDGGKEINYRDLDYLVKHFQISYSHSAAILKNTDKLVKSRTPSEQFVGFAPDYSGPDFTIPDSTKHLLAQLLVRDGNLPLPGAAVEVERIGELFDGKVMLKSEASESAFKAIARDYQILHLAMHSLLDDENPLNSELVFSVGSDSLDDGFLALSEIYNLDLSAEMVVLSACSSGYGKLQRGEGSISLSRAFRYAGSNSIVMSLWKIPDEATSEIMVDFYQNLLKGESKDAALREAKLAFLDVSDDPLLNHPYYWAGFVPIGDMAVLGKNGYGSWFWMLVLSGGAAFFLIGWRILRARRL